MKYSFVITYYNKADSLYNTLLSYREYYAARDDYEILILEDKKNVEDEELRFGLSEVLLAFADLPITRHHMTYKNYACACSSMNWGVAEAKGEYIILTNPENFHVNDILTGFDKIFAETPNDYIVTACIELAGILKQRLAKYTDFEYKGGNKWKQHSIKAPRALNWCSCTTKANYIKVYGFNEEFDNGIGRADVDFVKRVQKAGINIQQVDDLLTAHIAHPPSFADKKLVNANYSCRTFKSRFQND